MYFYLYQITNTLDGKIYVGCHSTRDLNDGKIQNIEKTRQAKPNHLCQTRSSSTMTFLKKIRELK
jgi:hypothetical protein